MLEAVGNAFRLPDVRRKLIFTGVMLVLFRFIAHVPVPGVNTAQLAQLFQQEQLLGMLDLFSGGAMTSFSSWAGGTYTHAASDTNCVSCHDGMMATAFSISSKIGRHVTSSTRNDAGLA